MVHTKLFGLLILAMIFIASTSLYSEDSPPYADETFAFDVDSGIEQNEGLINEMLNLAQT